MEYISAKDASIKWNISQRRVSVLCSQQRIPNAKMLGNMWIIPSDATKPTDGRKTRYIKEDKSVLKPFIKWAGGKNQLINEIGSFIPKNVLSGITKYAEPFVGGGAFLYNVLSNTNITDIYISDTNAELINAYLVIRDNIIQLIPELEKLQTEYLQICTDRKEYYYNIRKEFNSTVLKPQDTNIRKAALFIFLNKTCFNGLYRVNKKGEFNVPMGSYKNPVICDSSNLKLISEALQHVTIRCCDYHQSFDFVDKNTLVYFDPPYRPLPKTPSFTAYTENGFGDGQQLELADYIDLLAKKKAKIILSNSDPKNTDDKDNFFDELYKKYNIHRVCATRMINSDSSARGKISELLITNF